MDPQKATPLFGPASPRVFGKRMQQHKGRGDHGMPHDADGIVGELSYAMAASRRTEFRRVARLVKVCAEDP